MDVVVVGSCAHDLYSYTSRFPTAGEAVRGHDFVSGSGGKGLNQAVAAGKLGAKVAMVTRVGSDSFGESIIGDLKKIGINADHVTKSETVKTATASVFVADSGENMLIIFLGANMDMQPEHVDKVEQMIAQAKVLCCQLEIPIEVNFRAMQLAKKHNVTTIFNAAPGLPDLDKSLLQLADIVCVNENEAEMVTGMQQISIDDAKKAALLLRADGARVAIVTLGKNGMVIAQADEAPVHLTAPVVKAVDTVGAGDCFIGSLAFFLATMPHLGIIEQARRAGEIAAMSVQKKGAQISYPYPAEIDQSLLS